MDINRATISGTLTKDPEFRSTPDGVAVSNFVVATHYEFKNGDGHKVEDTEFHYCIAFRKLATVIGQFTQKGDRVLVEGRLKTHTWEKDGEKRYRKEIIAENVIFLKNDNRALHETSGGTDNPAQDKPLLVDKEDGQE